MASDAGTVIVADGHHQMLAGVHALLGELFDAVVMVADDRSLMEAVARMGRGLVVVIDLSLPSSRDDVNVAHRLAAEHPDLKVIVLSVHDEPAAVKQTLAAGAAAFVLKRSAATDLVPAVRDVLRGLTYVSPGVRARGRAV